MKKSIGKNLVCMLILSTFLLPLIGNTVQAHEPVTCEYEYISYDTSECWSICPWGMVDENPYTFAMENRHCITEHLDKNRCNASEHDDYQILAVYLWVRGYHTGDNEQLLITPIFNNETEGKTHVIYLPEGRDNADWSEWINITDDLDKCMNWTWYIIENLDCLVTTGCRTQAFTLCVDQVAILVTFIPPDQ